MAKVNKQEQGQGAADEPALLTITQDELEALVNSKFEQYADRLLASRVQTVPAATAYPDDMPERMVAAERKVREEAAIVNLPAYSRAQRMKAVEEKLLEYDDSSDLVAPYILYSLESCPHTAPTIGGHDFPKYILKHDPKKKNAQPMAAKKVSWLTEREAARIRLLCEIKFMKVPLLDETGEPIMDKRSGAPMMKSVKYSEFIRLHATVQAPGTGVVDDPGMLISVMQTELARVQAELTAFKLQSGMPIDAANMPSAAAAEADSANLDSVNDELSAFKRNAAQGEAEASKRFNVPAKGTLPV